MPVINGLNRGTAGQLDVTVVTATQNQNTIRNGRSVAADFSLNVVAAPATPAATDKVRQGILMRADNTMYLSTSAPSGSLSLPSGIRVSAIRVPFGTSSPTAPLRTTFDPLIGQVFIDAVGRLFVDI